MIVTNTIATAGATATAGGAATTATTAYAATAADALCNSATRMDGVARAQSISSNTAAPPREGWNH